MRLALQSDDGPHCEHSGRKPRVTISEAPRRVSPSVSSPQSTMNRKKILVVDDSLVILKTVSMKLTANGYDVVTAEDGSAAVSAVRMQKPDLILLDLSFPPDVAHGGGVAWDGFLIMNWLRRLEEAKHIPIIVITGGDPAKCKDRALAAGAANVFHKPINNDALLTLIRETLAKSTAEPPPTDVSPPSPLPKS
jgi:two-component system, OmpR family, KDP operon response regulator KdpE